MLLSCRGTDQGRKVTRFQPTVISVIRAIFAQLYQWISDVSTTCLTSTLTNKSRNRLPVLDRFAICSHSHDSCRRTYFSDRNHLLWESLIPISMMRELIFFSIFLLLQKSSSSTTSVYTTTHRYSTTTSRYPTTTERYPTTTERYPTTERRTRQQLSDIHWPISNVLAGLQQPLVATRQQLSDIRQPLTDIQHPLAGLQQPLVAIQPQLSDIQRPLNDIQHPLAGLQQPLVATRQQLSDIRQPLNGIQRPPAGLRRPLVVIQQQLSDIQRPPRVIQQLLNGTQYTQPLLGALITGVVGTQIRQHLIVTGLHPQRTSRWKPQRLAIWIVRRPQLTRILLSLALLCTRHGHLLHHQWVARIQQLYRVKQHHTHLLLRRKYQRQCRQFFQSRAPLRQ